MSGGAPSGPGADAWDAGLGEPLWAPPEEVLQRGARKGRGRLAAAAVMLLCAVAAMVVAGAVAGPSRYDQATALMVLAVILGIAGSWLAYAARTFRQLRFGVYPTGVLLPASFESVPGLSTLGGPVAIARADIDRVEDMRSGGDRAVVVWSKAGRSGVLSAKPAGLDLTDEESALLLGEFLHALKVWGVVAGSGSPDEPEGGGPPAPGR